LLDNNFLPISFACLEEEGKEKEREGVVVCGGVGSKLVPEQRFAVVLRAMVSKLQECGFVCLCRHIFL